MPRTGRDVLLEGRTAIIVAHRLSTAMKADRILVVDHGRIVESGPHDELWEACRAVGLDELVERLTGGLDAPVYERGSSLSSGERQLLALARAFLARPRVLVLDEATSNLDLRSESKIERALDALLEGRTAIVIAHRLATAMRADRIAVVDGGGISEIGSHDQLIALGGRYADMHEVWERHGTDPSAVVVAEVPTS